MKPIKIEAFYASKITNTTHKKLLTEFSCTFTRIKERLNEYQSRVNTEIEYSGRDMSYRGKGMVITHISFYVSADYIMIMLRYYGAYILNMCIQYFEYRYWMLYTILSKTMQNIGEKNTGISIDLNYNIPNIYFFLFLSKLCVLAE